MTRAGGTPRPPASQWFVADGGWYIAMEALDRLYTPAAVEFAGPPWRAQVLLEGFGRVAVLSGLPSIDGRQPRQTQVLQGVAGHDGLPAEQRDPLHQMAQLPHVARPVIALQPCLGRGAQPPWGESMRHPILR